MYVPIILGTAREGRQSEKAARFMLGEAKSYGFESEIIDARDYRVPATDNTQAGQVAKKLAQKITKADGIIIVSPEYNHGYPGELKMMLDLLYQQYWGKPLGICGVSSGPLGGARMVEQLRLVCVELRMVNIREALYFSNVAGIFDQKGAPIDAEWRNRAKVFLDDLSKHIKKA
jgi:NAD(P)H-dependent FMN reductase